MNKQVKSIICASVSALCLVVSFFYQGTPGTLLCLFAFAVSGYDVVIKAVQGLFRGRLLDENFLMSVAAIGAFVLGESREAVAVVLFYRIGELFEDYAVSTSRKAVQDLVALCPDTARVMRDGQLTEVDPYEVDVGEEVTVLPGDRIPIDGIVTSGESALDTASLTGESVPRDVHAGDEVLSGCINLSAAVTVKTTRPFDQSAASRILELVENASSKKAKTESLITRFARYYTPVVVALAVIIAVVPPLCGLGTWSEWIHRALLCLVVSCPCALVISVPLTFFCGIGKSSSMGVLVKGSDAIETASRIDTVLFDKTGTLTKGEFAVVKTNPTTTEEDLLCAAAYSEAKNSHPIALSLRKAYTGTVDENKITLSENVAGKGVKTVCDGHTLLAGNERWMNENRINYIKADGSTVIYLAKDGLFLGSVVIDDEIKKTVPDALASLRKVGIKDIRMLSGDREEHAKKIADRLGLDGYKSELLPEDKVHETEKAKQFHKVLYVGDGINDAPVLMTADVGVAMGAIGSDAAMDSADVIITDDNISKVASFLRLSQSTVRIAVENIVFALGVKVAVLLLGSFGIVGMWAAVFADVGVTVIAVLNAMRILITKFGDK